MLSYDLTNFTGSSGSVYTGLSVGSHMVEVIFTPTGSSQMFSFDSPLQFEVSSTTGDYITTIV